MPGDVARNRAYRAALNRLKAKRPSEFKQYYKEELAKIGLEPRRWLDQ
jgi:collagenase-like PrtC family protease